MHRKIGISIQPLYTCLDSIPILAKIWCDVLGRHWLPCITTTKIAHDLSHNISKDTLPITLVAKQGSQPIGMLTLCEKDGLNSQLTPWLSDFVISKSSQGQGVGNLLMNTALDYTNNMGYKKLNLFTFDQNLPRYYKRYGWETIGNDVYKAHSVTIMQIDISQHILKKNN